MLAGQISTTGLDPVESTTTRATVAIAKDRLGAVRGADEGQSADRDRAQPRRFTQFTRPVFPLPVAPRWNRNPWAFRRASDPAVTSDARRGGAGP